MKLNRRHTLGAAAALAVPALSAFVPPAAAQAKRAADIPLATFFAAANLSNAAFNPSGSHVALLVGGDGSKRRLVVLELATMKVTPVAAFKEADVINMHWINDRRLYLGSYDESRTEDAWRDPLGYAVDLNGENFRRLGWLRTPGRTPQPLGDDILYAYPTDDSEGWSNLKLFRQNTRSGAVRELDLAPWSVGLVLNQDGDAVATVTERGEKAQLRWRDDPKGAPGQWRVLQEWERFFGAVVWPLGLDGEGKLYVLTRAQRDHQALYTLDTKTGALSERPMLSVANFDMDPQLLWRDQRLVGVRVTADARTTVWFDADMKALQAKIDAKLPATSNLIDVPAQGASPWLLVAAYSDTRPQRVFAYHRETDKLTLLGNERSAIDPATQSAMDFAPYKARDGRQIPAYLTLPRSAGDKPSKLPLVVMVHGGPVARGPSWHWQPDVQFLASRGYAVLQPEFRGADGFGWDHLSAGFKQWGLAMQDDLADGVLHLVKQGLVDPGRVAILGGSYGGYAAMMGLVRHPEVFRCAVNYVGVTDLDLLYGASWSDLSPLFRRVGVTRLLGDRVKDAERLRETSPVHQAHRITQPVLMAYGRRDERVPIEHGERMRDALRKHNPNVEWVLYDKEGHGFYWKENELDFWGRVERFLAKHLAPKG
ncbi:MAG: S9 family peptidase [Burkholderiales bacterium]|nr:S9 family peptidase [Burkholderiales bacterium]